MRTNTSVVGWRAWMACMVAAITIPLEKGNAVESSNATDYSVASHWLTVPAETNKAVDVFYLYPTCWTSTNSNPEVCAIDNPSMLERAPDGLTSQAEAFETVGNIYAPFYRQSNLVTNAPEIVAGIPTTDAIAAFDYFINNFNNGRPFILTAHSQGANVLSNLLAEYMKSHPNVLARMIAAYVIGYPVTAEYLAENTHLKFAENAYDTGVIISYNTQAPGVSAAANLILWGMTGIVINPILWTRDTTLATTNQSFGSFMPNSNGVCEYVPQYADAMVDTTQGVLICSTADTNALGELSPFARLGIFHSFDYSFYYYNLRTNAAVRTHNFLNRCGSDYDGDGVSDLAIYDNSNGAWYVYNLRSGQTVVWAQQWGGTGFVPVPGDYDGDSISDLAVFDLNTGCWYAWSQARQSVLMWAQQWGWPGAEPVFGDYNGDGISDLAVYDRQSGYWYIATPSNVVLAWDRPWGGPGAITVPGDYDGDRISDLCVYDSLQGTWYAQSMAGTNLAWQQQWGWPGATTVPGDYDGDGSNDLAVYDQITGTWYVWSLAKNSQIVWNKQWGGTGARPVPGDYDGDGKADLAVFDTLHGNWYIWSAANNTTLAWQQSWGWPGAYPPGARE